MWRLWKAADFVRALRREFRFGEISRAPLQLLRVELRQDRLECDWVARPADAWDSSVRREDREQHESHQVLWDAIEMRDLVLDAFPKIDCAVLRAFRQTAREPPELILLGTVSREQPAMDRASSLVMRAKLYGFCFAMEGGTFRPLQVGESSQQLIS